jgi:hypothetical protein
MKFGIFFSLNDQKNDHTIDMVWNPLSLLLLHII